MSNLDKEYSDLLNYLESSLIKKEVKNKEVKIPPPSVEKKKEVENNTQKILKECLDLSNFKINTDVPSSFGFDSDKYENLLRIKLIEDHKKYQSYERPYISVLEIVSSCSRKVYYERLKYPVDAKKLFTFPYLLPIQMVGDCLHDCISDVYNFSETRKTIVSEKYKVKGKIDGLTQPYVYEIKTLDSNKFTGKYIPEHYYQGLVYAFILNSEYGYNITTITVIYQFRDKLSSKPIPFDIPIDDKLAISLLDRSLNLQRCLQAKEVPECIGATKETCNYCVYRTDYCLKEKTSFEQIKENKNEPVKSDLVFLL